MKKILTSLFCLYLMVPASFGQNGDNIRPAQLGVSFVMNDFKTAGLIRTTSLSSVIANKQWAKFKDMSPGIAITYFKGLRDHIDFAGTLAGSFVNYTLPNHSSFSSDQFFLEGDASANFKMVTEKYWVIPYLSAGVGGSIYGGKYWGAFVPLGVGMRLNLFDETSVFVNSQYRIPVTTGTSDYHFYHSFGIAGNIGKKKEPKVIPPPPVPEAPKDTDGDGITDDKDKCPTVPGVAKYDGCPVPDTDKDGIKDDEDKCPTVPGVARYQGCPVPDTDKDGINDEEDKCPTVPGVARYQGCPVPDTDGDGVNDEEDWCPTEKGLPEDHGCPKLADYNFNANNVQFATGSAKLLPAATKELDKLVTIMNEHTGFNVSIEGHTDNTGKAATNQALSEKRAQAAMAYLVKKGVPASRLTAAGFGQDQPVADNKTAKGRAANRRVEFKVVK